METPADEEFSQRLSALAELQREVRSSVNVTIRNFSVAVYRGTSTQRTIEQ
jgi:hypothetical protein